MADEITVTVENRPGTLAQIGEILGNAGVNINAIQLTICEGQGIVRFLPDDKDDAINALESAGVGCTSRQVLLVNLLDEPGNLGNVAFVMAHAGINVDTVYVTTTGQIVLGVDDVDGAIQVAAGMAVMAE
jgi:hypothetical protein